jgi:hypothetical protein
VAVIQLCFSTYHAFRARSFVYAATYVLIGIAAAVGARYFYGGAIALHREALLSDLSIDPPMAPDFSTLGDGSERVRNLHDVR